MSQILDPFTVLAMLTQLTKTENDQLEEYVAEGNDPNADEETEALNFLTRTSEWLIRWRAHRRGGGIG